jgi:hypothetical protein
MKSHVRRQGSHISGVKQTLFKTGCLKVILQLNVAFTSQIIFSVHSLAQKYHTMEGQTLANSTF